MQNLNYSFLPFAYSANKNIPAKKITHLTNLKSHFHPKIALSIRKNSTTWNFHILQAHKGFRKSILNPDFVLPSPYRLPKTFMPKKTPKTK